MSMDSNVPDCQDWTTVTFNKRPSNITNATNAINATHKPATTSSLATVGIYKAASDDDTKKTTQLDRVVFALR